MGEPAEEASRCSICLDFLLSQPACVLRCGHVYHSACFQQWLLKSRQQCPECRSVTQARELRPLDFDAVEGGAPQLSEGARRLAAASGEERQERQDDLLAEASDVADKIAEVEREIAAARQAASTAKAERKEAERQGQQLSRELDGDRPLLEEELLRCQHMQEQIDQKESQQHQKLAAQFAQSREGDEDVQQERRNLRSTHPADRAKQVHASLVAAHSQQIQSHSEFQRVQTELAEAQDELKEARAHVARLRKAAELDVLRRSGSGSQDAAATPASAALPARAPPSQSSQGSTRASTARASPDPPAGARGPKRKRSGLGEAQDRDDAKTMDLLYGAPPRSGAGSGFLSRRLPAPLGKPPAAAPLERAAAPRGSGPRGPRGERTTSARSAMAKLFAG